VNGVIIKLFGLSLRIYPLIDAKIVSLEKILSGTEDKIVALCDDYLFLLQEKTNLEGKIKQFKRVNTE
jgi:hypothetical protein